MNTDEEKLITDNLKIAYKLAHNYYRKFNRYAEFEEFKSLALFGLVKAAKTFDETKKYTFSTYAYVCIRNEIYFYLRKNMKYISDKSLSEQLFDELTIEDMIPDNNVIDDEIQTSININLLHEYIMELDDVEQKIMNYTLAGYTQSYISELIGYSQPQISRMYNIIINKLRNKFLR